MRHYKRWQKRLTEDPYNAIFGASNDMLAGKGVKDWMWVNNRFPKWMLREMEHIKEFIKDSTGEHDKKAAGEEEPKRAHSRTSSQFPNSSTTATRFDRNDKTGIASPSDLRRPREQPYHETFGEKSPTQEKALVRPLKQNRVDIVAASVEPVGKETDANGAHSYPPPTDIATHNKEASARESAFIEQFLTTTTDHQAPTAKDQVRESTWQQTALQRRALQNLAPQPNLSSATDVGTLHEATSRLSSHVKPTSATAECKDVRVDSEVRNHRGESSTTPETTNQTRKDVPQSTSQKLSQLPKHDIDFINADEIRAAIKAKARKLQSNEDRAAKRKSLEEAFQTAKEPENVDIMIEAKIVNDQMIRRLERELCEPERHSQASAPSMEKHAPSVTNSVNIPVESSIDRIRKWIEQGGAVFASHFWQDPTEETDEKKTRLFFDKTLARIRKSRLAMRQIIEDLETDIPASEPLLRRMKQDEDLLDAAIQALRTRSGDSIVQGLSPKKIRAIQTLRLKIEDTDRELETAYIALIKSTRPDLVAAATSAFKRRLAVASQIVQKNAHFTRYLLWGLQARLEDTGVNKDVLSNYKAVANSLLTLRDTQIALARLIDRAMSVYGVEALKPMDSINSLMEHPGSTSHEVVYTSASPAVIRSSQLNKAQIRADIATEERLASEVEAQKMAMQRLSDDGYAHATQSSPLKSKEESDDLAHRLFRPSGPVSESLTKGTSAHALETEEAAKKASHDANLVQEVRAAYEDTYGPITVGHTQLAKAAEEVKNETEIGTKQFDMLKDDPVTTSAHAISPQLPETPVETCGITNAFNESTTKPTAGPSPVQTNEVAKPLSTPHTDSASPDQIAIATNSNTSCDPLASESSDNNPDLSKLPTHYTILLYNPQTDSVTVSTSTSPPPRDITPTITLPQALANLDAPAKFVPYIPDELEIVSANKDMLVLRNWIATLDGAATRPDSLSSAAKSVRDDAKRSKRDVNPIDGTARLSPTGYVGPEESQEQFEKEFEERRQAAEKITVAQSTSDVNRQASNRSQTAPKEAGKGGAGSVVKTAIWAAATCYVFGVIGEIVSGP